MQYNLDIKPHNWEAHTDIETDIQKQGNGLYTFILRVDNGNIVDYNVVEVINASKYLKLKSISFSEVTIVQTRPDG